MTPSSLITIRAANSTSCNSNNSSSNNSNNNKNQNNNSNKKKNNNNKHNQQKPCVRHTMYVPLAASRCKAQVLAPTSAELPVAQPPKIEAFQVRDNPSVIWTDVPGIPTRQPRPRGENEKQTSREMRESCLALSVQAPPTRRPRRSHLPHLCCALLSLRSLSVSAAGRVPGVPFWLGPCPWTLAACAAAPPVRHFERGLSPTSPFCLILLLVFPTAPLSMIAACCSVVLNL